MVPSRARGANGVGRRATGVAHNGDAACACGRSGGRLPEGEDGMRNIRLLPAVCAAGVLVATAFAGRPAANGTATKLLRMPTVSATQIAFAYANNIWTVDRAGGRARR